MIKMYGPAVDGSGKMVNRDVPENDEVVYANLGYKRGSLPEEKVETADVALEDDVKRGHLPEDFPGYSALDAIGEATYAKVRKRIEDGTLTEIDGIGAATAEKIQAALE